MPPEKSYGSNLTSFLSTALRKIVAFLMQGDALALLVDALPLLVDALPLLADALALLADALPLLANALPLLADALALQGIAKFNSLRINKMLYLVLIRLQNPTANH